MGVKQGILLTFDYELFQGKRSGSVENCMIRPTDKILALLAKHKAKSVFFIDMMYLCRLKEMAAKYETAKKDFNRVEAQLIDIANQGHYVFNHLHPHWLDAEYNAEANEWTLLNDSKYAFDSLSEQERDYVFDTTMALLNEILSKAKTKQKPDGYRAGGLYIQPFPIFKKHFDKHGITSEFSVLMNATGKLSNGHSSFDFSGVRKSIYNFGNEVATEDAQGQYTEYAMPLIDIPFHYKVMNSLFFRLFASSANHKRYGDGLSTANTIRPAANGRASSNETFSVEMLNQVKLPLYIKAANETNYLPLLSHPKLVSDYNLKMFDELLYKLRKGDNVEFDFKKFEWKKF